MCIISTNITYIYTAVYLRLMFIGTFFDIDRYRCCFPQARTPSLFIFGSVRVAKRQACNTLVNASTTSVTSQLDSKIDRIHHWKLRREGLTPCRVLSQFGPRVSAPPRGRLPQRMSEHEPPQYPWLQVFHSQSAKKVSCSPSIG